ncbi:hypothetical protein KDA_43080 [Dictyobacter alpinus]|uniref:Uncharacterized protein n=1 Tax=Dictyobacter alpinus TaxID=2014873 RepID=A0A402BBW6_9CHLR|nr:hypothetical protein [Dictyobacter alpinus]GCE28824.1 hypothetical protein KDA_43080 [Dictyobacter alpinus]
MARTLDGGLLTRNQSAPERALHAVWTLRLALGLTALLGAILFLEGTSWDIQWHIFLGRDRTLIPPHMVMLTGVALSGISGLLAVVLESFWARRDSQVAQRGTNFASIFSGSLGAYIVGFAALDAAIAFPLDAYWHALYGIDVAIWAPFHIMFVAGMGVVALGSAYMLASAANLAFSRRGKLVASIGLALALATVLSIFTLLLFDSMEVGNTPLLGFFYLNFFPLLAGVLTTFVLVTAAYALPWRWSATAIVSLYLLLAGIMAVYVQPATDWLASVENLSYRREAIFTSAVTLQWFMAPVLVALLIDIAVRHAQHKHWSTRKLTLVLTAIAMLSTLPLELLRPELLLMVFVYLGPLGSLASYLLGLAGVYIGQHWGRTVGDSMAILER